MGYNKKDEDKVIDIINSQIDLPGLKYENVRSRINLEDKQEKVFLEREFSKKKFTFKKVFSMQFASVLICIMVVGLALIGKVGTGGEMNATNGSPGFSGSLGGDVTENTNKDKVDIKDFLGTNVLVKDENIYVYDDFDIKVESSKPNIGEENFNGFDSELSVIAIFPKSTSKLNITTVEFLKLFDVSKLNFVNGGSVDDLGNSVSISFRYSQDNKDGFMIIESNGKTYNTTYVFNYADIVNEYNRVCYDLKISIVAKSITLSYNESGLVFTILNISDREIIIYEKDVR